MAFITNPDCRDLNAPWYYWVFSAEGGGLEFPILLVTLALAVGLGGAGKYAIDILSG